MLALLVLLLQWHEATWRLSLHGTRRYTSPEADCHKSLQNKQGRGTKWRAKHFFFHFFSPLPCPQSSHGKQDPVSRHWCALEVRSCTTELGMPAWNRSHLLLTSSLNCRWKSQSLRWSSSNPGLKLQRGVEPSLTKGQRPKSPSLTRLTEELNCKYAIAVVPWLACFKWWKGSLWEMRRAKRQGQLSS